MIKKKGMIFFAAIALCSISLLANAASRLTASPLTIVNNTSKDSTSKVNGLCSSTVLGEGGITPAGQTKIVSAGNLRTVCYLTPDNCTAEVFMTRNCSGDVIATVVFSLNRGVVSAIPRSAKYLLNAPVGSFNIAMTEVP